MCLVVLIRLTPSDFEYGAFTLCGWLSQCHSSILRSLLVHNPFWNARILLGSFHFARRFGNRFFFLFLRLLRCFSSPGSPACLCIQHAVTGVLPDGFPHSDICGSMDICSPRLFMTYHVFLRLLVPRHPPALLLA